MPRESRKPEKAEKVEKSEKREKSKSKCPCDVKEEKKDIVCPRPKSFKIVECDPCERVEPITGTGVIYFNDQPIGYIQEGELEYLGNNESPEPRACAQLAAAHARLCAAGNADAAARIREVMQNLGCISIPLPCRIIAE